LFSITVVGKSHSGKTSLINAFVNNFCPATHTPTDAPELYYKTLQCPCEESETGQPVPVVVEIEDTYASERTDGEDRHGNVRDIDTLLEMTRSNQERGSGEVFRSKQMPENDAYVPARPGRMGFLFVFDAEDDSSYVEAKRVYERLEAHIREERLTMRPVVHFVANKCDKGSDLSQEPDCVKLCRNFTNEKRLGFTKVSAFEIKKVRVLFRALVREIHLNPLLWRVEPNETLQTPVHVSRSLMHNLTWGTSGTGAELDKAEASGNKECAMQ
jgi:GTPase SAR1 family protein